MAPLLMLPDLLTGMRLAPEPIITAAGIDPRLFDDAENTISFRDLGCLFDHCTEHAACLHLGLLIGRQAGLSALGKVALLARNASTLGSGLGTMIRYLHLHDLGAVPMLWERGVTAMLGYVIHLPEVPATAQNYDGAVAIVYNILKEIGGSAWAAREVCFHRPPPADLRPYREHFRARLQFGTEHAAVVFDASWLRRRLAGADAQVDQRALREAEALDGAGGADLPCRKPSACPAPAGGRRRRSSGDLAPGGGAALRHAPAHPQPLSARPGHQLQGTARRNPL